MIRLFRSLFCGFWLKSGWGKEDSQINCVSRFFLLCGDCFEKIWQNLFGEWEWRDFPKEQLLRRQCVLVSRCSTYLRRQAARRSERLGNQSPDRAGCQVAIPSTECRWVGKNESDRDSEASGGQQANEPFTKNIGWVLTTCRVWFIATSAASNLRLKGWGAWTNTRTTDSDTEHSSWARNSSLFHESLQYWSLVL